MSRFTRKQNTRQPNKVIRIYTEGTVTEPNYFNSIKNELRLPEVEINVYGCGDHTVPLVKLAVARKEEIGADEETEWWVVIDKDDHDGFDESISLAKKNDINVAYSNECFELWFILHFEYLNTSIGRKRYFEKLDTLLGTSYEKNSNIYHLIKDREATAIHNAKNLEKTHNDSGEDSFENRDPSTTVYLLVERIRSLKA
ncbi:MAG: RloB domain-containing protein [Candidatus Pacebacteria bacterium]|nr:RloB domain-containing protein [Candidatus Paceibacterota bacterium]